METQLYPNQKSKSHYKRLSILHTFVREKDSLIVGITETFLNVDYPDDLLKIHKYNIMKNDSEGFGGGVMFYVKSHVIYKLFYSSPADGTLEQLWIKSTFNKQKMIKGVVYRQPGTNVSNFLRELNSVIECAYVEADSIIVMGDININLLCSDSSDSKKFSSLLTDYGVLQMVKNPTGVHIPQNPLTM
ncbi:hypothetical protein JTB14_029295 [Gonioctena quinquepunctata]|nr:hypothetical protein JTB14_029295 [Gonioctena quinquepunctata]